MRGPAVVALLGAAVGVTVGVGCGGEYEPCYAGDHVGCTCADGALGYAACSPAGDYAGSACVCDGTTPGLDAAAASTDAEAGPPVAGCVPDAGDGGAKKKTFEPCASDEECDGCVCQSFGDLGPLCTRRCTTLEQCPAPSDACTNQGVCRPPG